MSWRTSEKSLELFIIQICCLVVVYFLVVLRFWTRFVIMKKHTVHDTLMYISMAPYTAQAIIVIRGVIRGGIGQHSNDLDDLQVVIGFQTWYIGEIIYALLSCLIKTSVTLYLSEAFTGEPTGPAVGIPVLRLVLKCCLYCVWLASVFFLSFEDPRNVGTCSKSIVPAVGIIFSVVLALSDWVLALVPIIVLRKVQLPWRTKVGIQALLSLGLLAAGAVLIVRIPHIKVLDPTKDFLYETVDVAKWTVIEAALGIAAGCIPTVRPLFGSKGSGNILSRPSPSEREHRPYQVNIEGGRRSLDPVMSSDNSRAIRVQSTISGYWSMIPPDDSKVNRNPWDHSETSGV